MLSSRPALRAFADGFGGAFAGGLLYCLALAYFGAGGIVTVWLRVLAVSLAFGAFEVWRVSRKPAPRTVRAGMLLTLALSLCLIWLLGAADFAAEAAAVEAPQQVVDRIWACDQARSGRHRPCAVVAAHFGRHEGSQPSGPRSAHR